MDATCKLPWKLPSWTVFYATNGDEWVGTAWEFFSDHANAKARYDHLSSAGSVPTLRPFNRTNDERHLGAAHVSR